MKINALEFKAFGPFTDQTLRFASALPGLHVVHGRNEAGKSSALRALDALLFGFPHRSADNFVHPYNQLLVGGCLESAGGEFLHFYRRKKARNDLFDAQDKPLPPEALLPFLHGLGRELFVGMYGITHETLVRGGQDILDEHGEVGRTLFAAGAGFASLRDVLKGLEVEAGALFRPRAPTAEINQALNRYVDLQKRMREVSLSGQEWRKHRDDLREAQSRLDAFNVRRLELEQRITQLERLRQAMPLLGQRSMLRTALADLGDVVELPVDFSRRRAAAEERSRGVRERLDAVQGRLERLRRLGEGEGSGRLVVDRTGEIESLHRRLGAYCKAQEDLPVREGQRVAWKSEAAGLLRRIRADVSITEVEALRPALCKRRTVQSLGQKREAVLLDVRQARVRLADVERERDVRLRELETLRPAADVDPLRDALASARRVGDVDKEVAEGRAALRLLDTRGAEELDRLGLWPGNLEQTVRACVPLPEEVERFEREYRRMDEDLRRLERDRERVEAELEGLVRDLHGIEHAGDVPSERDVEDCRLHRERGWQLLRRQWVDGEAVESEIRDYTGGQELPLVYEQAVGRADRTADRLYREADRVRRHAVLAAGKESATEKLVALRENIAAISDQRAKCDRGWLELWRPVGIVPRSPEVMRAWLAGFERVRMLAVERKRLAHALGERQERRAGLRGALLEHLGENVVSGAELAPVLARAELAEESARKAEAVRETLSRRLEDLDLAREKAREDVDRAERDWAAWNESWSALMVTLGVSEQSVPAEVEDYLDVLQSCFSVLDKAEEVRKRCVGMERDMEVFAADVRLVAGVLLPDDGRLEIPALVERLKQTLAQAQHEQAVARQREEEITQLDREALELCAAVEGLERELTELRVMSGASDNAGMARAEQRSAQYQTLRGKLADVEEHLARIGQGQSLEELAALAGEQDGDALPGGIEALKGEVALVDREIRALSERVGQEKNELARMDGNGSAAVLHEESQNVLASLARMAGRYTRLKVAAFVLGREIERYRETHQDPLLGAASRIFSRLTLELFTGLRVELDEGDRPVLTGVRANGQRVAVEGMSSGTRDQLYLSLRLAGLELRSLRAETLPFIVDDVLINFDEFRSRATLRVLADMAAHTQIILFTHQQSVADMALALDLPDRVAIHRL